jgi:5-methyltetrahydrofolate--homocysteine methyltransferase
MSSSSEQIEAFRAELSEALAAGDEARGIELARAALEGGVKPTALFVEGVQPLLYEVGKRFEKLEIFLPDLMKAAKVIKALQREVLEPAILESAGEATSLGTVILGTSQGDIHDIGKNMVGLMLQVNGFKVIDLGTDVPVQEFIKVARENQAQIIGMSSLLTTSMPYMGDLIERLKGLGQRDEFKVIVGGAPVTDAYAQRIGADAYGADAVSAVRICRQLVGREE